MEPWDIEIENVAGIRRGEATIHPGINTIRAENWRGKSSFIAAVETAMGTAMPLTEGQESGKVRLETADDTFTVELVRRDGEVATRGRPLLEDEYDQVRASLYAFMDSTNEVRHAVRQGHNLEAVLTRPLDFENLDERIADLRAERDRVEAELERAEDAASELTAVQTSLSEVEDRLETLRGRREELVSGEEGSDGTDERDALSDAKAERDRVAARVDRLEGSLDRAEQTLADRREELDSLDADGRREVTNELEAHRETLSALERDMELLQSAYVVAQRLLEEERFERLAEVEHGLMDDTVTCLLCGNHIDRSEFGDHLEAIGDRISDLRDEAAERQAEIDELEAIQADAEERERRVATLREEIADLEETVGERRESLTQARERLADLDDRIDDLSETVESRDSELPDIEGEIKYLEAEREDTLEAVERLEDRADARDRLADERDELTAEIESLRNRKEQLKRRTREAFDESMADLLSRFDTGFETARLTPSFDLVVARDGREASLDALSEGELELIGLVAALAGHRAFEVGDVVPLLLLDDLGGLSDDSLHTVVEMFHEHVDRVVLTAYPEHSEFDGAAIDPTDWAVVSDVSGAQARS